MSSTSPPSKRPRLSSPSPPPKQPKREPPSALAQDVLDVAEEDNGDCAICLQPIQDRTVLPCAHDVFCWECILLWVEHSRKCPLCTHAIDHLIHNIRSPYDYQKHFLPPLPSSSPSRPIAAQQRRQIQSRRNREWGRPRREREADELERAVQRRRWIYRNGLYAKHVASNPYTRYKPGPSPSQFAASSSDISRTAAFLRRELRVWPALDVEFLTTFILSLMRSLDIRSEASVKLLAEFLDMDEGGRKNAEHFAHEVYSYLRSPYRSLIIYDTVVQYDSPAGLSPTFPPKMPSKYRSPSPPPLKSPYNDEPYDSRADTTSKPYGLRPDRDNHTAHTAVPASSTDTIKSPTPSSAPPQEPKETHRGPVKLVRNRIGPLASIRAHISSNAPTSTQSQASHDTPSTSSDVTGLRIKSAALSPSQPLPVQSRQGAVENSPSGDKVDLHPPVVGLRIKNASRAAAAAPTASATRVTDGLVEPMTESEYAQTAAAPAEHAPRRPSATIMAEARARLAKELSLAAARPTLPEQNGLHTHHHSGALTSEYEERHNVVARIQPATELPHDARDDIPTPGLRTAKSQQVLKDLLLSKLQNERALLADSERQTHSEKSDLLRASSEMRESRLRAQAKAQVRLAAEKRVLFEHG